MEYFVSDRLASNKVHRNNNKKKIVLFTDWYEPGFKAGGPIRSSVNFAANMKNDYDIYVFTGDRDSGDGQPYANIDRDCWMDKEGIRVFYASLSFLRWKNILHIIQEVQPDFVYLNNMYSRYFTIYPLLMKRLGCIKAQIVLAPRGMLKATAVQYKTSKKKIFFRLLKWLNIPAKTIFHATDATEVEDIKRRLGKELSIVQISNFLSEQRDRYPINKSKGNLRIIFISRIHPIKNLLFLLQCLPTVAGEMMLTIVATIEDEKYWSECQKAIKNLPETVQVELKQNVPHHEIEELINNHHLFVLPTQGENFGHAILEALLAGRPVLISDQTPLKGLEKQHAGWDLPLSDQAAFIKVLQEVADMDNETFQQWSMGAWNYAKGFSDSSGLKEKYRELFS
ncbi:MAG: glycosyltransferase family 4 protein [Chitinophagaceae bacterium]|nr:glycosyltransferase family 4 protein [Chitinophagaceae bacterium]